MLTSPSKTDITEFAMLQNVAAPLKNSELVHVKRPPLSEKVVVISRTSALTAKTAELDWPSVESCSPPLNSCPFVIVKMDPDRQLLTRFPPGPTYWR